MSAPTIHSSARKGLSNTVLGTRNLMVIAALSVVGAIIVTPLTYAGLAWAVTPGGILGTCAIMGLWLIPYMLPAVVIRKPGAALIAGTLIGVIAIFTTPMGPAAIVGNFLGALLVELPLALLLYRKWTWWAFALSALLFGGFNGGLYATYQSVAVSPGMQVAIVVTALVSAHLGMWACLGIGRALNRAGVGISQQS